jgi:hypothetical protein
MTSFQSLPSSGSNDTPVQDRPCAWTVCPWVITWQGDQAPGATLWRFQILYLIQREVHLFTQAEGRRFSVCSSSINPTFLFTLLLWGYSMSASCDALFFLCCHDLPEASFHYSSARPPFGRHLDLPRRCDDLTWFWSGRRFFKQLQHLVFTSSPWIYTLRAWCSTSYALKRIFFFWIPVHPTWPQRRHVFALLQHDIVLVATPTHGSGLERNWYPWVPTN